MNVVDLRTGDHPDVEISKVEEDDLPAIAKSKQFEFDWAKPNMQEIYKLYHTRNKEIYGLMHIQDYPEELRVEIKLLEVSKEMVGRKKTIEGIAGCLIAFACAQAFKKGYRGFVSLVPKTLLIAHYKNKYGFSQYDRQLAIEGFEANQLMEKYLDDE